MHLCPEDPATVSSDVPRVDPRLSAFRQAWSDVRREFGRVRIGVVAVPLVVGAVSGLRVPDEDANIAEQVLVGVVSAAIALVAIALLLYLAFLVVAPTRQRNAALGLLRVKEEEIARLTAPTPEAILLVRVPRSPRTGHIDSLETVHFDQVLLTDLSGEGRVLRFSLSMTDRAFLDLGDFQEIYRDRPAIHASFLSNPLDLTGNRQGSLAFVHRSGSEGVSEPWELTVEDVRSGAQLAISTLGEHTCFTS